MVMKIPSSYSEQLCLHLVVEVYQLKESAYYWQLLAIIGHYVLCCDKVWLGFGDKIDISIQSDCFSVRYWVLNARSCRSDI